MRTCALLVLLAVAGCAGSEPATSVGPDAQPSARALAALADTLATAPSTADRVGVVERAFVRAGVTPLSDFGMAPAPSPRFRMPLGGPAVAGFVPGRDPRVRGELVLVGTRLEGPAVGAVLEAARVLVERSQWVTAPGRTVEVVFWSGVRSDREGARQALGAALWPRDRIRGVVVVGAEPIREVGGVPAASVAPGDALATAASVVERALALARYVPPADTLAADPLAPDSLAAR